MGDLEVSSVGANVSEKILKEVASSVNLPAEVCGVLFKHGWTLELDRNKPAMWVQAWPKELRVKND